MSISTSPSITPPESKDESVERTLKSSVGDGVAHASMLGCGESYIPACGVALNAGELQIGLLASLPPLLGAISQAWGVWAMEHVHGRRKLISRAAFLQSINWLSLAFIPFFWGSHPQAVYWFIGAYCLHHFLGGFGNPIWNSLMGDVVPPERRGIYFGTRSRLCGLSTFIALVVAGQYLEYSAAASAGFGFLVIFLFAGASRFVSAWYLTQYSDPPYLFSPQHRFSFWDFLRRARKSNFAKFVFFVSAVNFSVALGAPYFTPYLLRDLKCSYMEYMAISAATVLAQFLTLHRWGALSDRFGNKKILNICSFGVALNPVLWLFSAAPLWLMLCQFFGGFVWAGFNLAAGNFMFDAVSAPKRARCVAYQSIVNGTFVFMGSLIGGLLAHAQYSILPALPWLPQPSNALLFLFLISGIFRLAAAVIFLPIVKEVREVERIRHRDLAFRIVQLRPLTGATFSILPGARRRSANSSARNRAAQK